MLDRLRSLSQFISTYWQHLPLAKEAIFTLRCEFCLVKGVLRTEGTEITVLYAGRGKNKAYILEQTFSQFDILEHQRSRLMQFNRHLCAMQEGADVIINDIGWPYSYLYTKQKQYLEVPDWINMSLELADSWSGVVQLFRSTARNNDLRLIRRNHYQPEFTRDPEEVDFFYENFYLPFAQHNHGAAAMIASKNEVMRRARSGGLLKVKADKETVAAGVIFTENASLCFLWLGIPRTQIQAPAEAAISALYYFGIKYAFDNRCKVVDFTGSRAFLNDGDYRFKRKWGAIVEDTDSPSAILIKPQKSNPRAVAFCKAVPTIARIKGNLVARIVTSVAECDQTFIKHFSKNLACPGIDALSLIQLNENGVRQSYCARKISDEIECTEVDLQNFSNVYVNGG